MNEQQQIGYWKRAYEEMATIVDARNRQLAEAQQMPDGVRESIRLLADYGIPLGTTNAVWQHARDKVTAWLDS